ncbi:MAG: NADH-quinone oxidoreductase subunit N [Planctomycetota bacterium]
MAATPDLTQGFMQSMAQLTPVASLLGGAAIAVLLDLRKNENLRAFLPFVALLALLMAISSLFSQLASVPAQGFLVATGSLRLDGFSLWISVVIAIGAGVAVLAVSGRESMSAPGKPGVLLQKPPPAEYYALLLTAAAGAMLLTMANDLITALVALETLSIPTYVLCASNPHRRTSAEAGMKYFMTGAFSTGFLIFGAVFFYGATGSLSLSPEKWLAFDPFYNTLFLARGQGPNAAALGATPFFFYAAMALLFVGFLFKVGGVPFQQWVPDVYAGAPTAVTNFMATVVKAAAFAFLARLALGVFSTDTLAEVGRQIGRLQPIAGVDPDRQAQVHTLVQFQDRMKDFVSLWQNMLWFLAAATMILGNTIGLVQTNIKRMLAYSAIAHSGYLLMGVMSLVSALPNHATTQGVEQGIVFYLLSYALAAGGAFGVIGLVRRSGRELNTLDDFRGLARERPGIALAMTFFMLSLAGFPPFGGFIGKFMVFRGALDAGFGTLAVLAIITTIVSVYYYLGPVIMMYMKPPAGLEPDPFAPPDEHGQVALAGDVIADPLAEPAWGPNVLITCCAVGILAIGIFAQVILSHMAMV